MTDQEEEKRVAAAFNSGYLMEQYEPKLFQQIRTDANKPNEFVMYMDMGSRQYQQEQLVQQQKARQQHQRDNKPKHGR
jgi:hypothetical protein